MSATVDIDGRVVPLVQRTAPVPAGHQPTAVDGVPVVVAPSLDDDRQPVRSAGVDVVFPEVGDGG